MFHGYKYFTRGQSRKFSYPLFGLMFSLCVISPNAHSDIYKFTDERGTPNFSNVPTDERYVLAMRTDQPSVQVKTAVYRIYGGSRTHRKSFAQEIKRAAADFHVDPALLHAVIATESGFEANAVSGKGAMGLMQLMPETARRFGVTDPFNPEQNIRAGAQYLNSLMQRFNNDLQLALAAYNSGETNVVKYGEHIPPFLETKAYVPKVIGLYQKYQREVW